MAYSKFPLFQSHLDLSHSYWEKLVHKGDIVIDATCGNGHDSLKLAQLALTTDSGNLWAFDIQEQAIKQTFHLLSQSLEPEQVERIRLLQRSHAVFPDDIANESVKLIVYNLGYLPGGNKAITTAVQSTLQSLDAAQKLISPGGAICLTCYPGHAEGAREQDHILDYTRRLHPRTWNITFHQWLNRHQAPALMLLQKTLS